MAKIKITESQLKMIAKHKALNEMMDEPTSFNLIDSIIERLSLAIQMEDWYLVKEVYGDLEKMSGNNNEKSPNPEEDHSDYEMPGYKETMNDLNNLSIRENEISLNEGQLLLKKVYNQFK